MKLFSLICALSGIMLTAHAAEVPLFPAQKKNTQVTHAAFESDGSTVKLAFKLKPDTAKDFAVGSIYLFADKDSKTGRKGIGNEYFLDIKKSMISTYAADGKGKLHRKAIAARRDGDWYILSFSAKLPEAAPLKEFEIVFNVQNKRDRITLRGIATEKAQIPAAN